MNSHFTSLTNVSASLSVTFLVLLLPAFLAIARHLRRTQTGGSSLEATVPIILLAIEAAHLWTAAVSLALSGAEGDLTDSPVLLLALIFAPAPPLVYGCGAPGQRPSLILALLLPYFLVSALIIFSCLWFVLGAFGRRRLPSNHGERTVEHKGLLGPKNPSNTARPYLYDTLAAHIILLHWMRTASVQTIFRTVRFMMGGMTSNQGMCEDTACLVLLTALALPIAAGMVAFSVWFILQCSVQGSEASNTWTAYVSRALPLGPWTRIHLVCSTAAIFCLEFGYWNGRADAQKLGLLCTEGVLLAEVLAQIRSRWSPRSARLRAYLIFRLALLASAHLLATSPLATARSVAELSATITLSITGSVVLVFLVDLLLNRQCVGTSSRCMRGLVDRACHLQILSAHQAAHRAANTAAHSWCGLPTAEYEPTQLARSARELPQLALHMMSAHPQEFGHFLSNLTQDECKCLDASCAIVRKRVDPSVFSNVGKLLSRSWATDFNTHGELGNDFPKLNRICWNHTHQGLGATVPTWNVTAFQDEGENQGEDNENKEESEASYVERTGHLISSSGKQPAGQFNKTLSSAALLSSETGADVLDSSSVEDVPKLDLPGDACTNQSPSTAGRQEAGRNDDTGTADTISCANGSVSLSSSCCESQSAQSSGGLSEAEQWEKWRLRKAKRRELQDKKKNQSTKAFQTSPYGGMRITSSLLSNCEVPRRTLSVGEIDLEGLSCRNYFHRYRWTKKDTHVFGLPHHFSHRMSAPEFEDMYDGSCADTVYRKWS